MTSLDCLSNLEMKPLIVIASACMVLVCAVAFLSAMGKQNVVVQQEKRELGFIINARAEGATDDSAELSYETQKIDKDRPLVYPDPENKFFLKLHYLYFDITGEDISTIDVKSEHGTLDYHDTKFRLKEDNVVDGSEKTEYFVSGREFVDLPFVQGETYLMWRPDADKIRADTSEDVFFSDCLKSAEDYNNYFADTVSLAVKYKDGRQRTINICINFDSQGYVYAGLAEPTDELRFY